MEQQLPIRPASPAGSTAEGGRRGLAGQLVKLEAGTFHVVMDLGRLHVVNSPRSTVTPMLLLNSRRFRSIPSGGCRVIDQAQPFGDPGRK